MTCLVDGETVNLALGNFIFGSEVSLLPHSEVVMLSQYVND